MNKPIFYLGPMSKNIIDIIIEYSNNFNIPFTFIPSRRQIEHDGGYVNNMNTHDFVEYVRSKSKLILIERDHAGPGQGTNIDDGLESLKEDCKYMDIIHIDPWKLYQNYNDGLQQTIKLINYCYNLNKNIHFEISTEESIRKFTVDELENLIIDLQKNLKTEVFKNIKYLVIQSGTSLLEDTNTGNYDKIRLTKMINLSKKYGFISKEHNGDWISIDLINEKLNLGLDTINIAPELGQIETNSILKAINNIQDVYKKNKLFEKLFNLCFNSKKWVKWVSKDFIPEKNKEKLIKICGHYVFSYPEFQDIKSGLHNVDTQIKKDLLCKLREYHSLYDSYYKVLITTSGIGRRLGNLTKYTNKSLIKVGDKLAICHIIEKYNKYLEFIITLGYYGNFVKDFLELAYPEHHFKFIWVDKYEGSGSSLAYSLLKAKDELNCPFMFNCCDSLTKDNLIIPNENTLFVNNLKSGTLYSTINVFDKYYIKKINLKGEINFDYLYTGISFIKNFKEYWELLELNYNNNSNDIEIGDVEIIQKMLKKFKFKYIELNNWYDSGNLTELSERIKEIYKSKYTVLDKNNESICFFKDYVIKFFYDEQICSNRIKRGVNLYPLTPKIIDYKNNFIKMELVNGNLMSDLKTHGEISNLLNWAKQNLWISTGVKQANFKEICRSFYIDKTMERIKMILDITQDNTIINNINIGTIYDLFNKIDFNILFTDDCTHFHGDFILDNIIKTKESYKLLDWRQDFGGELYNGDKYYDLAKLRHNIIFNHENIANNLYDIVIKNNNVFIDLKCNYSLINQLNDFDDFVLHNKLNLKKIKILTALIWINMSPLHEYPLNEFLFNFGKYNLYLELELK